MQATSTQCLVLRDHSGVDKINSTLSQGYPSPNPAGGTESGYQSVRRKVCRTLEAIICQLDGGWTAESW